MSRNTQSPTFEMKMVRKEVEAQKELKKQQLKAKLRWETTSQTIIKEKMEKRKLLGFKNDWKLKFYETKLSVKSKLIAKITDLIK